MEAADFLPALKDEVFSCKPFKWNLGPGIGKMCLKKHGDLDRAVLKVFRYVKPVLNVEEVLA